MIGLFQNLHNLDEMLISKDRILLLNINLFFLFNKNQGRLLASLLKKKKKKIDVF